jgi:peptide/nickel transport system substrate-binding protein
MRKNAVCVQPFRLIGALMLLAAIATRSNPLALAAGPEGVMTWAVHVTIAPRWLDPGETESAITPFMVLYAIHDALVKPMPAGQTTPSLAESWTTSPDGLAYEFVLRSGATFHNGDPVTAEDVKFSFERYKGGGAQLLKDRVRAVEAVDPRRVRFRLKEAWPDFMTFYGTTATGVGWVVPKKYVEKVGDEGFRKAPIGAGPYRFVSSTPGIEMTLEAFEGYWRKSPKRAASSSGSWSSVLSASKSLKRSGHITSAIYHPCWTGVMLSTSLRPSSSV